MSVSEARQCSYEQLLAMAKARDAVRAETLLILAQTMNASQGDRNTWMEAQEKLIEQTQF